MSTLKEELGISGAIRQMLFEELSNTHTIVLSKIVNVKKISIDVKPVINRVVRGKEIVLPLFIDVPPIFLQGGDSHTTYPLRAGDYCLLLVSERCIDNWFFGKDFKAPLELRKHDYSDSFALVGVNPLNQAKTIPSVITTIGDIHFEGNHNHIGNITVEGNIAVTGNITATGDIVAGNGAVSLLNHTHTGVHGETSKGHG